MKRVLFTSYTGDWTGPTNSLLNLLVHLRSQFQVSVLLPGTGEFGQRLETAGIEHQVFEDLSKWSIPHIAALIRRRRVDVVYANNTHGSSRNAAIAALLAGVPFVCHVRGVLKDASWLRLWYLRTAAAVVAVSRAAAAPVRRFVRRDRLRVVYNGIPEDFRAGATSAKVREFRRELGISADATLVSSVGHVKPLKGHEHAIRALRALVREFDDVHLAVAGSHDRDPAYLRSVRQEIDDLGLSERVHLLGFRRDIPALLGASSLYLHSSLSEAHPRAVLEAMAFGLPVVAFPAGGVRETVVDGITGILVPPGDEEAMSEAVAYLLRNPNEAEHMGRRGRRAVMCCFSAQSTAEQIAQIIESL